MTHLLWHPPMSVYYRRHDSHDANGPHNPSSLPEADLEILRGAARERLRRVTGPAFLVGTANDCDLVLGDSQFPSVHSCLLLSPTGVTIRHLGFDPELTVNDEPVDCVPLQDGDRIGLGRYEFRIHIRMQSPRHTDDSNGRVRGEFAAASQRKAPDESARTRVRNLLAEIRQVETPPQAPSAVLKLYLGQEFPKAPLAKRIRRA